MSTRSKSKSKSAGRGKTASTSKPATKTKAKGGTIVLALPPKKISWKKAAQPSRDDCARAPAGTVFHGLEESDEMNWICIKLEENAWAQALDFGYAMAIDDWRETAAAPLERKDLLSDLDVSKTLSACDKVRIALVAMAARE